MDKVYLICFLSITGALAIFFDNKGIVIDDVSHQHYSKLKDRYLLILCFVMYLVIALRGIRYGSDTYDYVKLFMNIKSSSGIHFYYRDPGFDVLQWLIRQFTSNGRIFLFLVSWPMPLSFYLLFKSEKQTCSFVYFGFIVLLIIELFAFSMGGLRQIIAIFFTVLAYQSFEKKRIFLFVLSMTLAILFHFSSFVFLLYILLRKRKFSVIHVIVLLTIIIIVKNNPAQILQYITNSFVGKTYWSYGTVYKSDATYTMMFIQLVMLTLVLVNRHILVDDNNKTLLNNAWIGILAGACSPIIAEFFRVAFYFSIYLCLLIPRAIFAMEGSNRKICTIGFLICAWTYMLLFTNPLNGYQLLSSVI